MYASSGENSCVGATSSVSLEGERELISVGEVEQNAKHSERSTCEQTGAADQGLPQLLHYHNTRKQHLACCYCSNLKTDWQDLQVLSLSSPWPLWPLSSLWTFAVKWYVGGLFAVVADFCRIIWLYVIMQIDCFLTWRIVWWFCGNGKKKICIVWFYNWPYLVSYAKLINPRSCDRQSVGIRHAHIV